MYRRISRKVVRPVVMPVVLIKIQLINIQCWLIGQSWLVALIREQHPNCALSQWTGLRASQGENCWVFHLYLCPSWLFFKPQTSYSAAPGLSYLSPPPFQLILLEVWHTIYFNTLSQMDSNHTCTHPVATLTLTDEHTRSENMFIRAFTHTLWRLAWVTSKSMSTYLKSTGNTNKPV